MRVGKETGALEGASSTSPALTFLCGDDKEEQRWELRISTHTLCRNPAMAPHHQGCPNSWPAQPSWLCLAWSCHLPSALPMELPLGLGLCHTCGHSVPQGKGPPLLILQAFAGAGPSPEHVLSLLLPLKTQSTTLGAAGPSFSVTSSGKPPSIP